VIVSIVRHAWAADRDENRYPDDGLRPLTERGCERFTSVVERLAARGWAPTRIATSPLLRCCQTAELLSAHLPSQPELVVLDALEPASDLDELLAWTRRQKKHSHVAWVGHAPDVSQLTAALMGDSKASIRFAKGAVAKIQFSGSIRAGQGELHWLVTAKMIGC